METKRDAHGVSLIGIHLFGRTAPLASTDGGFRSVGDPEVRQRRRSVYVVVQGVDLIIRGGANVNPAEVETARWIIQLLAGSVVVGSMGEGSMSSSARKIRRTRPTLEDIRGSTKGRIADGNGPHTGDRPGHPS
jgi:hypothetical protein